MSKATVKKVREATRKAGGSTLTKGNRSAALNKFFEVMRSEPVNIQVKSFHDLKVKHVRTYVERLKKAGLQKRSIHNVLSHIRQALRSVGRGHFADSDLMSNCAFH
jgi:site-specific recombinase XerC